MNYLYSFDLSRWEKGCFYAYRHPANRAVSGDWVCLAKNDAEAFQKAKKAAYHEWYMPETRHHLSFEVEFIDCA